LSRQRLSHLFDNIPEKHFQEQRREESDFDCAAIVYILQDKLQKKVFFIKNKNKIQHSIFNKS